MPEFQLNGIFFAVLIVFVDDFIFLKKVFHVSYHQIPIRLSTT